MLVQSYFTSLKALGEHFFQIVQDRPSELAPKNLRGLELYSAFYLISMCSEISGKPYLTRAVSHMEKCVNSIKKSRGFATMLYFGLWVDKKLAEP